eukprot:COSAG03_NODE_24718_length_270_cov_0.900585_1_plen_24_part_01
MIEVQQRNGETSLVLSSDKLTRPV